MERQEQKFSLFNQLKAPFAGAFSGCVTRCLTQPLDCSKVRLQLQVESSKGRKYKGTMQTLFIIFREEGVYGLWKGHIPAQLLSVFYGIGQFAAYDQLNRYGKHLKIMDEHSNMRHFICGGIAGAIGNLISSPFDVLRTRIIAQDHGRGYNSMREGLKSIYVNEGFRGLFRGLGPSVVQVAPLTALQFLCYNVVIEAGLKYSKSDLASPHLILMAGMVSGIVSKAIVYPLDLAKKRLQIQKFSQSRTTFGEHFVCTNFFDCVSRTVKKEGYAGLYKGIWPSVFKSGLATSMHFFMYEQLLNQLAKL